MLLYLHVFTVKFHFLNLYFSCIGENYLLHFDLGIECIWIKKADTI